MARQLRGPMPGPVDPPKPKCPVCGKDTLASLYGASGGCVCRHFDAERKATPVDTASLRALATTEHVSRLTSLANVLDLDIALALSQDKGQRVQDYRNDQAAIRAILDALDASQRETARLSAALARSEAECSAYISGWIQYDEDGTWREDADNGAKFLCLDEDLIAYVAALDSARSSQGETKL